MKKKEWLVVVPCPQDVEDDMMYVLGQGGEWLWLGKARIEMARLPNWVDACVAQAQIFPTKEAAKLKADEVSVLADTPTNNPITVIGFA